MSTFLSTINSLITIEYLTSTKENQYFERKGLGETDIKPTKIADELIGMLNADGGVLVFGISNKGEIQNLHDIADKLDPYRSLVFDFIHPPCTIELEEITVEGNLIFIYHVEHEIERIFSRKDNEQVFLRVIDTNRKLDREGVKKLEYDKAIRKFEDEFVDEFEIDDLDHDLLNGYKESLNYEGNPLDLLTKRHLAVKSGEDYRLKKAAILLFSKAPEKYVPSASLRYIRYDGEVPLSGTEHNVIKDQRFEHNIPSLIDQVRTFLKTTFRDYYFLDINDGKFKIVPEYPEEAWLEAVVNALCHRSYNIQGNAIYIKHFDDRIEISNSGPLPAQVTVENIKTERYARNPRVARVLEDMGYVRQLNEGVSRIYKSMEKSMLSVPEYEVKNKNVYLTLRNKISSHSKTIHNSIINWIEKNWSSLNDTQKKILVYLFYNQKATKQELAEYCNTHIHTIRRYLNDFADKEIIESLSHKKRDLNAKYTFKQL